MMNEPKLLRDRLSQFSNEQKGLVKAYLTNFHQESQAFSFDINDELIAEFSDTAMISLKNNLVLGELYLGRLKISCNDGVMIKPKALATIIACDNLLALFDITEQNTIQSLRKILQIEQQISQALSQRKLLLSRQKNLLLSYLDENRCYLLCKEKYVVKSANNASQLKYKFQADNQVRTKFFQVLEGELFPKSKSFRLFLTKLNIKNISQYALPSMIFKETIDYCQKKFYSGTQDFGDEALGNFYQRMSSKTTYFGNLCSLGHLIGVLKEERSKYRAIFISLLHTAVLNLKKNQSIRLGKDNRLKIFSFSQINDHSSISFFSNRENKTVLTLSYLIEEVINLYLKEQCLNGNIILSDNYFSEVAIQMMPLTEEINCELSI